MYNLQLSSFPIPHNFLYSKTLTSLHFSALSVEITHASISFGDTLGKGQFGDVFKGIYTDKVSKLKIILNRVIVKNY